MFLVRHFARKRRRLRSARNFRDRSEAGATKKSGSWQYCEYLKTRHAQTPSGWVFQTCLWTLLFCTVLSYRTLTAIVGVAGTPCRLRWTLWLVLSSKSSLERYKKCNIVKLKHGSSTSSSPKREKVASAKATSLFLHWRKATPKAFPDHRGYNVSKLDFISPVFLVT